MSGVQSLAGIPGPVVGDLVCAELWMATVLAVAEAGASKLPLVKTPGGRRAPYRVRHATPVERLEYQMAHAALGGLG